MNNKVFDKTKEKLNTIGCGFCLAKWTQVTMIKSLVPPPNSTFHTC